MTLKRTHKLSGLCLHDREHQVPLDHAEPTGESITVFTREVVSESRQSEDLPWLLFLQGGPGFPSPRPMDAGGWLGWAAERFRVVLLDQRGTGQSSPLHADVVTARGDAQAQADFLSLFRSDSIVEDCELIRHELTGGRPWTTLGQSYGGFCTVRYLSAHPEGLRHRRPAGQRAQPRRGPRRARHRRHLRRDSDTHRARSRPRRPRQLAGEGGSGES